MSKLLNQERAKAKEMPLHGISKLGLIPALLVRSLQGLKLARLWSPPLRREALCHAWQSALSAEIDDRLRSIEPMCGTDLAPHERRERRVGEREGGCIALCLETATAYGG